MNRLIARPNSLAITSLLFDTFASLADVLCLKNRDVIPSRTISKSHAQLGQIGVDETTHLWAVPCSLDTVPDTTANRAHGEGTSKVIEDDIGATGVSYCADAYYSAHSAERALSLFLYSIRTKGLVCDRRETC